MKHVRPLATLFPLVLLLGAAASPPKVGDTAPDFTLNSLDGTPVHLADVQKTGPVVVIELRGWVGYQCPLRTRQVGDFIGHADQFKKAGATVILIYPGPAEGLKEHAADFIAGKGLPDNFRFVLDPGLVFVNQWGLRWDKPGETADPATFVVNPAGTVTFAKVSHSHGGRSTAAPVLAALAAKP